MLFILLPKAIYAFIFVVFYNLFIIACYLFLFIFFQSNYKSLLLINIIYLTGDTKKKNYNNNSKSYTGYSYINDQL